MRQLEFLDKIDGFILAFLNFLSNIYFFVRMDIRKVLRRNTELKTNKTGDKLFILGNGPSLKDVDFEKISNQDCMTVNYFYNQNRGFVSKYFVAVDTAFYSGKGLEYIKEVRKKYPKLEMILKFPAHSIELLRNNEHVYFIYAKLFQHGDLIKADCTKNMTAGINVVLQCIQIGIYMGYKEIYLLGCDFNQYATLSIHHYYDTDSNGMKRDVNDTMGADAKWSSKVHYHHYALRKYADSHGVKIINLTPGSLIDAYQRDELDNVLLDA